MNRKTIFAALAASLMTTVAGFASDAATSASAGSRRPYRDGTASATARYQGDQGFARTDARSGRISTARGVAVGVDEDGLSLSLSNAFAPQFGPALATNFNLSIGRDGQVSGSTGLSISHGPVYRSATAGGQTGTGPGRLATMSYASGQTDPLGRVIATTRAEEYDRWPRVAVREPRGPHPHHHAHPVRVVRIGPGR